MTRLEEIKARLARYEKEESDLPAPQVCVNPNHDRCCGFKARKFSTCVLRPVDMTNAIVFKNPDIVDLRWTVEVIDRTIKALHGVCVYPVGECDDRAPACVPCITSAWLREQGC